MPAKYLGPYSKGHKNDFRDAEAIAEAVQRPTMKFVATKTAEQLDLQALHRVRERLVSQRTGIVNQVRAFLLELGVAVRQGLRFLRAELPRMPIQSRYRGRRREAQDYLPAPWDTVSHAEASCARAIDMPGTQGRAMGRPYKSVERYAP